MIRIRLALLLLLAVCVGATSYAVTVGADEDEDEREESIGWKEVPDAVKATILMEILREVDELRLEELERETGGNRVIYEAEFEYGCREIELEITPGGKLIRKEVEMDDAHDRDDDEVEDDERGENREEEHNDDDRDAKGTTSKVMMKIVDTHQQRLI